MFDNYIFTENTCKDVKSGGKTTGFELKTLIPYYRGIPYSMIHDIRVEVDGKPVDRDGIRFSADGADWFTLKEIETVTSSKWEYGQQGTIRIEQEDGLPAGEHDVTLAVVIRTAYIPVPFEGTRTRRVTI